MIAHHNRARQQLHVVVIDDRPSNRAIYAKAATSLGGSVQAHTFSTSVAALRWLRGHPADLVISDLWTSDLTGIELLTVLRKQPSTKDVPVLIITADATAGLRGRVAAAGATDLVLTPIRMRDLRARLHGLLNLGAHS